MFSIVDRDRSKGSKSFSTSAKTSHHYAADDVTIDTWEPSLPRPKIRPGAFSKPAEPDDLEMNERRQSVSG